MEQLKFKRYEFKYLIDESQYDGLVELLNVHARPDVHKKSTVCNLYYDTPTHLLIRRSIEKPVYKEKLRLRCYGVPHSENKVFVELKKKYESVVYKRRIKMKLCDATQMLEDKTCEHKSQVIDEILYFANHYQNLQPSMCIFYDREAYYGKDDDDLRITFDDNVLFRTDDLQLEKGIYGERILDENVRLLEIKTSKAIPLWLATYLSKQKIYKTSFSKYGTAYGITERRK